MASTDLETLAGALAEWQQGDCVVGRDLWFLRAFHPSVPFTPQSRREAAEGPGDSAVVEEEVPGFVVVSQTCDVVRLEPGKPYVDVAPLLRVDNTSLAAIAAGKMPGRALIPALRDQSLVADLTRTMSVEKPVVASWARTAGCRTDAEKRAFAYALARVRRRFAFPDDFVAVVTPMSKRIKERHARSTDEGRAAALLDQIRVTASPDWDAPEIRLLFWFIVPTGEAHAGVVGEAIDGWLRRIAPSGRFGTIDHVIVTLEDMTAREYVDSVPLDLEYLSTPK